ncbi:MAG: glucose-6-phosphate isomerase, partial [Actinobacteria bacterium]|nr:glucose-6-phosphate isomerase [Actinomycetota bacterium]
MCLLTWENRGVDLTSTPEWRRLLALGKPPTLRELFSTDPDRARRYRFTCADLTVDLSKNWLTDDILRALVDVADASALSKRRTAMFAGEHINSTEDR